MSYHKFALGQGVEVHAGGRTIARTESLSRGEEYLIEYNDYETGKPARKWFPWWQLRAIESEAEIGGETPGLPGPDSNVIPLRAA